MIFKPKNIVLNDVLCNMSVNLFGGIHQIMDNIGEMAVDVVLGVLFLWLLPYQWATAWWTSIWNPVCDELWTLLLPSIKIFKVG